MKKSLIALAALAATGAFAQSSVTLYGIVEAGVDIGFNARTQTTTVYRDSSGTNITGRINGITGDTGNSFTAAGGNVNNQSPFVRGLAAGGGLAATQSGTAAAAVPGANATLVPVFGVYSRSELKPGFRVQDGNSQGTGTSRIGFRGTEDLGGGMKANFQLEMGIRVDDGCATTVNPALATAGVPTSTTNTAAAQCVNSGDSGSNLFGRNAWGGLEGAFGQVRIGRQVLGSFSVQGNSGASGSSSGLYDATTASFIPMGGVRFSDAIKYMSPNLAGFSGEIMFAAPEVYPASGGLTTAGTGLPFTYTDITYQDANGVVSTLKNKRKTGVDLALNYANGPIYVGFGYNLRDGGYGQQYNNGVTGVGSVNINTEGGTVRAYTLGGSYDFGVVKPFVNYTRQSTNANALQTTNVNGTIVNQGLASDAVARSYSLGLRAPVGPVTLIASVANTRTTANAAGVNVVNAVANTPFTGNVQASVRAYQIGAQYALSKRTMLQANYGQVTTDQNTVTSFNGATAATNGNSIATVNAKVSAFNVGMRHNF